MSAVATSPTQIGSYRILGTLGAGGMGEVFLARSVGPAGFAKLVVIKRILRHLDTNQTFINMFLNEARLAALLQHPNVVQVFELGQEGGSYFLVMEYVHGVSARMLQQRMLQQGMRIPPRVVVQICLQALKALDYAHTLANEDGLPLDIVHRDITPDNLLIGFNGVVKVLDFGIAKASMSIPTTVAGTVKGKFAYMSPEQIHDLPLDARSDVFAMGVVMYELLCGKPPFAGGSDGALLHSVLERTPDPLSGNVADLPLGLEAVVEQALVKDRILRTGSARELFQALERCQIGEHEGFHLSTFIREQFPEKAMQGTPSRVTQSPITSSQRRHSPQLETAVTEYETIDITSPGSLRQRSRKTLWVAPVLIVALALGAGWVWRSKAHPVAPMTLERISRVTVPQTVQPPPARVEPSPSPPPVPIPSPAIASGAVHFRVNPWAEVVLDGKSIGMTPMPPRSITPGDHVLLFRNSELHVERRLPLKVLPGQRVTVKVDLLD